MGSTCRCGAAIGHDHDALGCLECGQACCPACAVDLESATYCRRCARALLGPDAGAVGSFEVQ